MKIYCPTYVKNFKCDGKVCSSRCCRDWRVLVDEEIRQKYLSLPDHEDFFRYIDDSAQAFHMQNSGACPFLDEKFLCKLQLKHGEAFLPAVCQSFPRVTYKLDEEIFTQAMTLTCPVAAVLILLHEKPLEFEVVDELKTRQIFDFTKRISDVKEFLNRQRAAIKILQRRDLPLNQRLKELLRFFGEEISEFVVFNEKNHATALVEIFNEMYEANLTFDKKNQLTAAYRVNRKDILLQLHGNFAGVLENYLVNEFFMRCYPSSFGGDEKFNCRVFVTTYRAIEFATVLATMSKSRLTLEDFLELLCALNDKLDHSKGGMEAIKSFAALKNSKDFYSTMIE